LIYFLDFLFFLSFFCCLANLKLNMQIKIMG
jgi:hypothetical protein